MKGVLHRLARTTPDEWLFRGREWAHRTGEALVFGTGGSRWSRRALAKRLVPTTAHVGRAAQAIDRRDWVGGARELRAHFLTRPPRFPIDPARYESIAAAAARRFPGAAERAAASADRVLDGHYDLLGYRGLDFRTERGAPDWHADPVHGRRAPALFWARVRYLDPAVGDHKIIWELNRHQHWLRLGRAAWLSGDSKYSGEIVRQLQDWMAANPPFDGINWASMLELGFRSLSWIWALHFVLPFDEEEPEWILDLLVGLDRQLNHVSRHLSVYFSPNTHLLGEGLALYVAGRVLPELASAARWEAAGRDVLLREARAQVNTDGGHAERSPHYHRYALDFYLFALVVARQTGDPIADRLEDVALRMSVFCRSIAGDDGRLPTIGDDDGGRLFPMCDAEPFDATSSLAAAAALLGRPEIAVQGPSEEAFWFCGGSDSSSKPTSVPSPLSSSPAGASTLFPETGYAVLRRGNGHALVDVGRHGFMNGGHAHADALSLVLSVADRPLLIDPGTATYTTAPDVRDRFRSTAMHNTVLIDGRSQGVPAGPFHWQTSADASVEVWRTTAGADYIEAGHDAYLPLVHRRAVLVDAEGLWLVADHVLGGSLHQADAYWHFDPSWTLVSAAAGHALLTHRDGTVAVLASTAHSQQTFHGDAEGLGWCAPVYGQLLPSSTLRLCERGDAPFSFVTAIAGSPSSSRLSLGRHDVLAGREDGWHRVAVAGLHGDDHVLALFATRARGSQPRSVQRVAWLDGELSTDARAVLFRVSAYGDPSALTAIEARVAAWTGQGAFEIGGGPAADLHLDRTALARTAKLDARCG